MEVRTDIQVATPLHSTTNFGAWRELRFVFGNFTCVKLERKHFRAKKKKDNAQQTGSKFL